MPTPYEIEVDLAWWLEQASYEEVLDALIRVCTRRQSTSADEPPPEGPAAQWKRRAHALRRAQGETEGERSDCTHSRKM